MFKKVFQWLFKSREGNLIELLSLFIGLLLVSVITSYINLGRENWYLIIPILILLIFINKAIEFMIGYLFRKINRKVNEGYFVLVIFAVALFNTFILY